MSPSRPIPRAAHARVVRIALASLALLIAVAPAASAGVVFRRIALTGDPAPGTPSGVFFTEFGTFPGVGDDFPPRLDADGNAAFHAVLAGPGVTGVNIDTGNGLGIWRQVAGVTTLIARQDDAAPGTASGVEFRGFTTGLVPEPPSIASGRSVFAGALRGPGVDVTNENGLWRETEGGPELLLRVSGPAPGLPAGHTVRVVGVPFEASSRRYIMNGLYARPGDSPTALKANQEAFWSDRSGAPEALALGDHQAPGLPAGVVFGMTDFTAIEGAFRSWGTNDALALTFVGNLKGPGIDAFNDEGIWIEQGGALALLVREGDPSPAIGPGVRFGINNGIDTFGEVIPLRMNAAGALLFGARHRGGAVPFTRALWTTRSGGLELIAYGSIPVTGSAPGSPAPGMGPGATFSAIPFAELNDANEIAFSGFVTIDMNFDNQPQGVWWDRPGALTLVACEGDPVPGLPGLVFGGFNRTLSFGGGGVLAFLADLSDGASGDPRGVALVLTDPVGGLHVAVRSGEPLDVAGDGSDLRVVAAILPGIVSTSGEIPMELGFADGSSGLFAARLESQPVAVEPAPSTAAHLSLEAPRPNPRAGATPLTLRFAIGSPAAVRFRLLDLLGREVAARPAQRVTTAGEHEVRWNPGRLPPGVYFLRLELGSGASVVTRCAVLE